jgi:hypothetical protein
MTRHRAPFDAIVLAATVLSAVVLGGVVVLFAFRMVGPVGDGAAILIGALTAGILLGAWGTSPTAYRVEAGRIVVERPFGEIAYPLPGLVDVKPFDRAGFAIRVFGNGGLFGVTGWFWSRKLGWFRAHGRKARGAVSLHWPDRTVVLMPEERERFIADVERFAPKRGGV